MIENLYKNTGKTLEQWVEIVKKQQTYIYIAVACLNVLPKELKNKKKWTLYKLPIGYNRCFWIEAPMNKFDTKGLPFYTLRNDWKAD
ncbi:MAG: hypothetical protein J0I84_26165 [Terrimonas sp.]|nr:hypothetical protein [Terrimonas sp.]OJY98244.1 MAG: hypothetical protein BGP13_11410 [Sphingobacteriales bacterium 40-81]